MPYAFNTMWEARLSVVNAALRCNTHHPHALSRLPLSVLFAFLFLFSLFTTMLIAAFFKRTTLAALVGIIVYLLTYLSFVITTRQAPAAELRHYVPGFLVEDVTTQLTIY